MLSGILAHTSSIPTLVQGRNLCVLDVTIAVPDPDAVNGQAVLNMPPHGQGHINVARGARSPERKRSDVTIISNAAVMVNLDV